MTMIIAEAGVNHNGSLDLAKKLVDASLEAGADYVKFQTFKAEDLVRRDAELAEYQKAQKFASQFEMLRSLELSNEAFTELFAYAKKRGAKIFSTAFDLNSLRFLIGLGQRIFKISSGDVDNLPLFRAIVAAGPEQVILSTGASTLDDVKKAVDAFLGLGLDRSKLTVLHCTSQYPCPPADVNIRAMVKVADALNVSVGYSDHTEGFVASVLAIGAGARIIEKHMTLDRSMSGPDHKASLDVTQFKAFVGHLREAEAGLGTGEKKVAPSESANRKIIRKSIVARTAIARGEVISADKLSIKRPADGLSPMEWDRVVGTKAVRDFKPDEPIVLS